MGMNAAATVAYGIALGNGQYGEWNFGNDAEEFPEDFALDDIIEKSGVKGIESCSYGYEWSGWAVVIPRSVQRVSWGCGSLKPLERNPDDRGALLRFIQFMDGDGLVLKEGFRTPRWLLMESYG